MVITKRTIRRLWLGNFLLLLAALLPSLTGHPYPRSIGPYLVYGLLVLYLLSAIWILIIVAKARERPRS